MAQDQLYWLSTSTHLWLVRVRSLLGAKRLASQAAKEEDRGASLPLGIAIHRDCSGDMASFPVAHYKNGRWQK